MSWPQPRSCPCRGGRGPAERLGPGHGQLVGTVSGGQRGRTGTGAGTSGSGAVPGRVVEQRRLGRRDPADQRAAGHDTDPGEEPGAADGQPQGQQPAAHQEDLPGKIPTLARSLALLMVNLRVNNPQHIKKFCRELWELVTPLVSGAAKRNKDGNTFAPVKERTSVTAFLGQ